MRRAFILTFFAIGLMFVVVGAVSAQSAVAPDPGVVGEWDATMNTPGGPRPFKMVFKVDGEKLSGTVKRNDGELPLAGTIKGKEITFSYTITYNEHDLTLSFTGTVNGDVMSGDVSFGGNGEDQWSAKRTPPAKPKTD